MHPEAGGQPFGGEKEEKGEDVKKDPKKGRIFFLQVRFDRD